MEMYSWQWWLIVILLPFIAGGLLGWGIAARAARTTNRSADGA